MNPATSKQLAALAEPLRSRIAQLLAATGDRVWIVSGRRSVEEQVQLRRTNCGPTWNDIWLKPANACSPPTAIPGKSKHQQGLAVDLGGDVALAERVGAQLGLGTPVKGEAWHFELGSAALGLNGVDIPGGGIIDTIGDVFGDFTDGVGGAAGDVLGGIAGGVGDAIGSALGALVEPLLAGLRRITLVALLLAGGVTLVVLGGIRGTSQGGP